LPAKGRRVFCEWNEGDGGNFGWEGLTGREVHPLLRQFVIFEELVIRNEIHRFSRWSNWLRADEATEHFSVDASGNGDGNAIVWWTSRWWPGSAHVFDLNFFNDKSDTVYGKHSRNSSER